jgi:hypothetical protein
MPRSLGLMTTRSPERSLPDPMCLVARAVRMAGG